MNRSAFIRLGHRSGFLFSTTVAQTPLPATFLRGGTSKGIFVNKAQLPSDQTQWNSIFQGIMGSPDPEYGRQLDGMGGGISSLSKICVVGEPTPEQRANGIQIEYTFVQVGIRDTSIDISGNCGNLSAMIGAYALDEGLVSPHPADLGSRRTIRSFNTNTKKIIDTTFPVCAQGLPALRLPETTMAGVSGKASQIIMEFVNPAGARTGKLLPTSNAVDQLSLDVSRRVPASLVDATNPTVFISQDSLEYLLDPSTVQGYYTSDTQAVKLVSPVLESIRQAGAVEMGLDPQAQAQPKIAILSSPEGASDEKAGVDVVVRALSMGALHKAVPMTVGLCLGVAARTPGTLAWEIVRQSREKRDQADGSMVRIRHPGGLVDVGAEVGENGDVQSAKVIRTGKFLMKGVVWW